MIHSKTLRAAIAGLALGAVPAAVSAQTPGVGMHEIVIGTIQDLSGPLAGASKQIRDGIQLRVDEINDQGGIGGRRLRLVVEDNGYDPRKAALAAQKLVNGDKVFAVLAHVGTMTNLAAAPVLQERSVINFMPASGARQMFEPADRLKAAWLVPYLDEMRLAVGWLVREKGARKVGILYQDDEFGLENQRGVEAALGALGMTFAETASFKRGATDFSSQMARLKAAGCDLVVLAATVREAVGAVVTARKIGFDPDFLAASPSYHHLVPVLAKGAAEGLYAIAPVDYPYADAPGTVGAWARRYKARFSEDPSTYAALGYIVTDIFGRAAARAGAELTVDTFNRALESGAYADAVFGTPECRITSTKRLCSQSVGVAQVRDGRWTRLISRLSP